MRRLGWLGILVSMGAAFAACDSTVYVDDGACDAPCEPDPRNRRRSCPVDEPQPGDGCSLPDGTECKYGDIECETVYSCEPVYPEAGAPSEWVVWTNDGCGDPICPANQPPEGSACEIPMEGTCSYGGSCFTEMECVGGAWTTTFQECPCAPAACDPGDTPVRVCAADASCYQAFGVCGDVLLCLDAIPEHGCPQPEPAIGSPCGAPKLCTYPVGNGCFEFLACDEASLTWQPSGGGCEG